MNSHYEIRRIEYADGQTVYTVRDVNTGDDQFTSVYPERAEDFMRSITVVKDEPFSKVDLLKKLYKLHGG